MNTASKPTAGVKSSRRILDMLFTFSRDRPVLTVAELAKAIDVPLSTAYRYVTLLREVGLVDESQQQGGYRITERVWVLADAARAAQESLLERVRPLLGEIMEATGETAVLIQRLGEWAVCVDRVESQHPVRLSFEIGRRMSLTGGSASRLLLAHMPPTELTAFLAARGAGSGIEAPSEAEIAQLRTQGWAESFGEVDQDIWGTAAVIVDRYRGIVGALGVAGPLSRLNAERRAGVIAVVRGAAQTFNGS